MIDLEAIRARWAPAFNGFIDLAKVQHATLVEKLALALADVHALMLRVDRVEGAARLTVERHRARPCADAGKDCSICALGKVLDTDARLVPTEPAPAMPESSGDAVLADGVPEGLTFYDVAVLAAGEAP